MPRPPLWQNVLNLGSPSSSNAIQFGIEANELVETRRSRHAQRDVEQETRGKTWKLLGRNWSKLRRDFVKWCTANQWRERKEGGRGWGLQIQTYLLISQLSKLQRQRALIDSQVESHALLPIKFDVSAIYKCLLHSNTPRLSLPPPPHRVCDLRSLSGKKGRCISIQ